MRAARLRSHSVSRLTACLIERRGVADCLLCASCVPEVMIGDDTFASFARANEDQTVLYTGRPV